MSDNPFNGPHGANEFGVDILDAEKNKEPGARCPRCSKRNFTAYTCQYGLVRKCLECKETWSGGTAVSLQHGKTDFNGLVPPKGHPAPDDTLPAQFTGAGFRDPSKNYDGDE